MVEEQERLEKQELEIQKQIEKMQQEAEKKKLEEEILRTMEDDPLESSQLIGLEMEQTEQPL